MEKGNNMPNTQTEFAIIKGKMQEMRELYPSLRHKPEFFVFSALCVKANYYKNPAFQLNDNDFANIVVDAGNDGGVDILLSDPNSESSDLIIGQSKFYEEINRDDIFNALKKMTDFYNDMIDSNYGNISGKVQSRFMTLNSEVGEESKVHFVLFTSALKKQIKPNQIIEKIRERTRFPREQIHKPASYEFHILFASDIHEAIKEAESQRPTVEAGKLTIDFANNVLWYNETESAVVNVSALSIKQLYAQYNTTLLARNLRYHVKGDIDKAIRDTIDNDPEDFWYKNNGITIICDDFKVDGKEVKLKNFSIINGGQTTYMIHKNDKVRAGSDFYLPCKIIKVIGDTEDEKNSFILEIAKATNSQKAIKPIDLKANAPEQIRFVQAMRTEQLFYQTKRGERVPDAFREPYKNTDLVEVGKLCLAAIFQVPCTSRSKPSSLYKEQYYNPVFLGNNQPQIAQICKELLYIDNFYRKDFIKEYEDNHSSNPEAVSFARNARTICIAFVALASRYYQNNISDVVISKMNNFEISDADLDETLYDYFKDIGNVQHLLPVSLFAEKEKYDIVLTALFNVILDSGIISYNMDRRHDHALTATNYLKKDRNYYTIIAAQWPQIQEKINKIFNNLESHN